MEQTKINMSEIKFHTKDISILRQSQQKMALEYCQSINVQLTVEELQMVTDVFVECCLRPIDKPLKERIKKMDNWLKCKQKLN